MPDVDELLQGARDAISVKRVFGDPIERNGITVIPVAHVAGAGGGGGGGDKEGNAGSGGGFGGYAWPAGVYVIRGEEVRWQPTVNATALALAAQKIVRMLLKAYLDRRKHRRKRR